MGREVKATEKRLGRGRRSSPVTLRRVIPGGARSLQPTEHELITGRLVLGHDFLLAEVRQHREANDAVTHAALWPIHGHAQPHASPHEVLVAVDAVAEVAERRRGALEEEGDAQT